MCKRFIAIPLLCLVVIMAACPFSVFADSFPYPENNVSGSFTVYFASFNATGVMCQGSALYNFGQLWSGKFLSLSDADDPPGDHGTMGYSLALAADITLSITVGGDLFLALPYHLDETKLISGSLSAYRSVSGDYSVDLGDDWPVKTYTPVPDSNSFVSGSGTGSVHIRFLCYRNVPAGDYTISYEFSDNSFPICFGVYASLGNQMNAIVDEYLDDKLNTIEHNGISVVSLTDILQELWEYRQSLPDDTVDLSILYELEYQSSVEYLMSQVDSEYVKFLETSSLMTSDLLIDLASGLVDYNKFIFTLTQVTNNASNFCSTVDQYTALNGVLQNTLTMAEQIERIKAKNNLDNAISDGDIEEIQSYYDAEQELISAFDQAKFKAQLDFDTWFTLLPPTETIEYKKIFDYILNDSPIKNYIMIPVSMGLVTILLGTGIRFVGSKRGDDHD